MRSRSSRRRPAKQKRQESAGSLARFFLTLVIFTWALRSFVVQPFDIPSGSMLPTLYIGDYLFTAKWPYGYSRFSFPFAFPSFHGRIVGHLPARGDVVVFRHPTEDADLIKRVIGLPGDHVVCCTSNRMLMVNNVEINEPYLKPGDQPSSLEFDIVVPEGHVWVMGDHRSDSEDSRFHDPSGTGSDGSVSRPICLSTEA